MSAPKTNPKLDSVDSLLPLYMGTHQRVGHYLFTADGRQPRVPRDSELYKLDGGRWCGPDSIEGAGKITVLLGRYTVLGFPNRTDDSRGGSHAVFAFAGALTFDEAVEAAQAAFPWVWERFKFKVYEYGPAPAESESEGRS